MIQHILKFIFVRVLKKKGILGTFKYLASTFYLFVKKGFLCAILLIFESQWIIGFCEHIEHARYIVYLYDEL